jgi:hypothetical protein
MRTILMQVESRSDLSVLSGRTWGEAYQVGDAEEVEQLHDLLAHLLCHVLRVAHLPPHLGTDGLLVVQVVQQVLAALAQQALRLATARRDSRVREAAPDSPTVI